MKTLMVSMLRCLALLAGLGLAVACASTSATTPPATAGQSTTDSAGDTASCSCKEGEHSKSCPHCGEQNSHQTCSSNCKEQGCPGCSNKQSPAMASDNSQK